MQVEGHECGLLELLVLVGLTDILISSCCLSLILFLCCRKNLFVLFHCTLSFLSCLFLMCHFFLVALIVVRNLLSVLLAECTLLFTDLTYRLTCFSVPLLHSPFDPACTCCPLATVCPSLTFAHCLLLAVFLAHHLGGPGATRPTPPSANRCPTCLVLS